MIRSLKMTSTIFALFLASTSAQVPDFRLLVIGVQPLTDVTLREALAAGASGTVYTFDPIQMRETTFRHLGKRDPLPPGTSSLGEAIFIGENAPFRFYISTPYSRAMSAAYEATRRMQPMQHRTTDQSNADGVHIIVLPGRNLKIVGSIEDVIVIRKSGSIRGVLKDMSDVTVGNLFGASPQSVSGIFQFLLDVFAPTEDITIRLAARGATRSDTEIHRPTLSEC